MLKDRHLKFASRTIILVLVVSSFAALSANYTIIPVLGRYNYDYPQQAFAQSGGKSDTALNNFIGKGKIDSVIYTVSGRWNAFGNWVLVVSDGVLKSFNTDMIWNNRTASHTHEFRNFEAKNHRIELASDGSVTIKGKMDVGTNHVITWQKVPAEIVIEKGRIITVSLDDEKTNHHFGDQTIHGTVDSLKRCSTTPGPDMQVSSGCA